MELRSIPMFSTFCCPVCFGRTMLYQEMERQWLSFFYILSYRKTGLLRQSSTPNSVINPNCAVSTLGKPKCWRTLLFNSCTGWLHEKTRSVQLLCCAQCIGENTPVKERCRPLLALYKNTDEGNVCHGWYTRSSMELEMNESESDHLLQDEWWLLDEWERRDEGERESAAPYIAIYIIYLYLVSMWRKWIYCLVYLLGGFNQNNRH